MSRRGQQQHTTKTDRGRRLSPSGRQRDGHGHEVTSSRRRGGEHRSPLRSKLMAMSGSLPGEERPPRDNANRRDDRHRGSDHHQHAPSRHDQHDTRDRGGERRAPPKKDSSSPQRRLRMDEHRGDRGEARVGTGSSHHRSAPSHSRADRGVEGMSSKKKSELDRVVKRAREDDRASSFWNKKILEEEEKDPERWGHSGFKELYRKDFQRKTSGSPHRRGTGGRRAKASVSRSRSRSFHSRSRSRSPVGPNKLAAR